MVLEPVTLSGRLTGTLLSSRYRLQRLLGQGGMGAVYEAVDETTGLRVAVKIVHAEVMKDGSSRDDTSKLVRFTREAKAAAAIDSEHVARVTDWGTDEATQQQFMVMELLEGEDLQQVLKRAEVLSPDVALRIVAQACEGLTKAHETRVTHRDIKPANLFLSHHGPGDVVVKLLDFGIAKVRPEADEPGDVTNLTRTGSMLGSPRYMSPEQARGSRSLDHRSDIWSLGVVLYRAITGHMPHEDAEAMGDFIVLLCSEQPRRVQKYAPWVDARVASVVEGALQIDREKRFQSADAMLDAIRAIVPNTALRAHELVALPEANRNAHPSSAFTSGEAVAATTVTDGNEPTIALPGRGPSAAVSAARREDATTPNTLANAPVETMRRSQRPLAPIVVGVGVVALLLLAFVGIRSAGLLGDEPASAGSTSTSASETGPEMKRTNVHVSPEDALVEVDGTKVTLVHGSVEIAGKLGSVHKLRVTKEGNEQTFEVVIAERGAQPFNVELPALSPTAPTAPTAAATTTSASSATSNPPSTAPATRPTPKKTATPTTPTAPTPSKNPLMPERFE